VTLNSDLIQARFEDIHQSLKRLGEIRELSRAQFLADQDTLDIACYRLPVTIEAAVPICFHVTAQWLHRVPETYTECFGLLGERGILSEDLSQVPGSSGLQNHRPIPPMGRMAASARGG
jgi:uncharacterized protein YutE (UPF0331/DUF86 family)